MTPERFKECEEFGAQWEAEGPYPEGAARKMVFDLCAEVRRLQQAVAAAIERCAQVAYDYEAAIKAAPTGQADPYWYAVAGAVRFVGDSIRETAASE